MYLAGDGDEIVDEYNIVPTCRLFCFKKGTHK